MVGGGPGGCACAIALRDGAATAGRDVAVVLFEPKDFGEHYNQYVLVGDAAGLVRPIALALSKRFALDPVLALARENAAVRRALYLCVSGEDTYRNIVRGALRRDMILPGLGAMLRSLLGRARYAAAMGAGQPGGSPPQDPP